MRMVGHPGPWTAGMPDSASYIPRIPNTHPDPPSPMKDTSFRFRSRALTSLLVALGFFVLLVSGGVLFLAPPGRVANWTQWQILGLTKHGWGDLHIAFGAVFLVAAFVHLIFNGRPMLRHLGARMSGRGGLRIEWVVALLIGAGVFAATRAQVPPVSTLLAWSERLRGGWEESRERAPIPHAELLTLDELASQAGVAPEEALRRLEGSGATQITGGMRVQAIADAARLTPAQVYDRIRTPAETGAGDRKSQHSAGGPGAGGGPGWKTLARYCDDEGLDLAGVKARLAARGIRFTEDQTLREIAVGNGYARPYELLEVVRQK